MSGHDAVGGSRVLHDAHHGHDHDARGDQPAADYGHGHSHGLVDRSITRSRAGIRVVVQSLILLLITAVIQAAIYVATDSIALLADLIHNAGDALTAIPLATAFWMRSEKAERYAGMAVVLTILASGIVALVFAIDRIINPLPPEHLLALALAGVIGVIGNAIAARIRLRGGRRLSSPALVADGQHAQSDAFVSIGVVLSAIVVALGAPIADPIIGLTITCMILYITWQSWDTVRSGHATENE